MSDAAVSHSGREATQFKRGHTQYRAKRDRIVARAELMLAEYDCRKPSDQILVALAAKFLDDAEHGKTQVNRTRAGNAAVRILRQIPRKHVSAPSLNRYREAV